MERSHCTIKCFATRMQCSLIEAVYRPNVIPKDDTTASTAPANLIYTYCTCIKGTDTALPLDTTDSGIYTAGGVVWLKKLHRQCTIQFKEGKVMKVRVPDVRLMRRAESTSSHITTSDKETPWCMRGRCRKKRQCQLEVQAASSNEMSSAICQRKVQLRR